MSKTLAACFGLACLLGAESAWGELADDVAAVAAAWHGAGAVRVLGPMVMQRGDQRPILLSREESDGSSNDCVDVALLGATAASFATRVGGDGHASSETDALARPSVAGVVELVLCGARKAAFDSLAVEMRSPRAVVQAVVARGPAPHRPIREILPQRDPGPPSDFASSGPSPLSAPLAQRTGAVEDDARRSGAAAVTRRMVYADSQGSGEIALGLDDGCFRIDLLGAPPAGVALRPIDVDAEVALAGTGEVLAADRSDNADATGSFCLGTSSTVRVRYAGAPPAGSVMVMATRWPLPPGVPAAWGSDARAHIAEALREHRISGVTGSPVFTALGVSGVTALPIDVEPGACYTVVATSLRGHPDAVALASEVEGRSSQNRSADGADSTALSFCAGGAELALVEVEAQGPALVWFLSAWLTGRAALGEDAP